MPQRILEGFPDLWFEENWRQPTYICCFGMDQLFFTGFKSSEDAGQSIRKSPLIPREAKQLVVTFDECDGTLSCINITLRRLDKGRSSSHGSSTNSSSSQYVLEVNVTPSGTWMEPTMVLSIIPAQIIRPQPPCCRPNMHEMILVSSADPTLPQMSGPVYNYLIGEKLPIIAELWVV